MSVQLCDICRLFDIRELLLRSESQKSNQVLTSLAGAHQADLEWRPGIPDFFPWHKSFTALEEAVGTDCTLCKLVYERWPRGSKDSLERDKAIDDAGLGQLFLGTSRCNVSRGEVAVLIVSQRPVGQSPRTLCTFDVCAEKNSLPWTESTYLGLAVSSHSGSEECKVTGLEWLQNCLLNHPECGPSNSFRRPTRLIYVGSESAGDLPRLEVDTSLDKSAWVALSYSWGGESDFVLNAKTLDDMKGGIPLERFPATLRDAILITRGLHIRFLWIDALCILQDSTSDWRAEAARMRNVYSGAALTIIAAESQSSKSGIYSTRDSTGRTSCELAWGEDLETLVWIRPSFSAATDVAYSNPLQRRGWTLQEGLLAPRTITYRKDQMVWECSEYRKSESGSTVLLDHVFDSKDLFHNKKRKSRSNLVQKNVHFGLLQSVGKFNRQLSRIGWLPGYLDSPSLNMQQYLDVDPYGRWFDIVYQYSQRKFTKDTDMLPALGGVARAFADITRDKYCCGMWEDQLLQELCWFRLAFAYDEKTSRHMQTEFEKPTAYRAPSWSWASINGGRVMMTSLPIPVDIPVQSLATVVEIFLEPLDKDPFGELKSGHLRIKGSVFELGDLWHVYWRKVAPSREAYQLLPQKTDNSYDCLGTGTGQFPFLRAFAIQYLNSANGTFEFDQQHVAHPEQQYAAFLIAHCEGYMLDDAPNEAKMMSGTAEFLLLESTGNKDDEYRRIGRLSLRRPWELGIIDRTIDNIKTSKWRTFSNEDWSEFDRQIQRPAVSSLESKAWIEVAKQSYKRIKICII